MNLMKIICHFLQRGDILPSQNKLLLNKDELLESLREKMLLC